MLVIAFVVVRAFTSMNKKSSTEGNRSQWRRQTRDRQGKVPGASWPLGGSVPNVTPMGESSPAWPPVPPQTAAETQAQDRSLMHAAEPPAGSAPSQPAPPVPDELSAATGPAAVTVALSAKVTAEPALSPSSPLTSFAHDRSDIGSAALDSTLDSTIESSLFGVLPGPIAQSVLPGTTTMRLPAEIEAAVVAFMDAGQEVGAVRFLCDELDMGILDALRAARAVAEPPVS